MQLHLWGDPGSGSDQDMLPCPVQQEKTLQTPFLPKDKAKKTVAHPCFGPVLSHTKMSPAASTDVSTQCPALCSSTASPCACTVGCDKGSRGHTCSHRLATVWDKFGRIKGFFWRACSSLLHHSSFFILTKTKSKVWVLLWLLDEAQRYP